MPSKEFNLYRACDQNDLSKVRSLLKARPKLNLNWKNPEELSRSPFFVACENGHLALVEFLSKDPRVDVNQLAKDGTTPFAAACQHGHLSVIELLSKDPRVDVNQPDENGGTPFFIACEEGHLAVVEFLSKDPRVDVNQPNKYGDTPFYTACRWDRLKVIEFLSKDPRVDVIQPDIFGDTPFFTACKRDLLSIVEFLSKDPRVDVNQPGKNDFTPFAEACQYGQWKVAEFLFKEPKVAISEEDGNRSLWWIVRRSWEPEERRLRVIEGILSRWEEYDVSSEREGKTLMGLAEKQGEGRIMGLLQAYSADPRRTRLLLRKSLGVSDSHAAATFALMVFFCGRFFEMQSPDF